jgi:dTDP-4-dehydrorhamnose 3,5-epimerase
VRLDSRDRVATQRDIPAKDEPHIAPDGTLRATRIAGVVVHEGGNIITRNGHTTELFSSPWDLPVDCVRHVIHVSLRPAAISAWHMHERQTDQIIAVDGMLKLVLHDPRDDSPTNGQTDVFHLSPMRPTLVLIPPGVWHGIQNMNAASFSSFINLFDRPYEHDSPDEWRLPLRNDVIPFDFTTE